MLTGHSLAMAQGGPGVEFLDAETRRAQSRKRFFARFPANLGPTLSHVMDGGGHIAGRLQIDSKRRPSCE